VYRVRSGAIEGMANLVRQCGANPIAIIQEVGLSESQFRNPDTYIPYDKLADIMELCATHCGTSLFGVRLAEQQGPVVLGGLVLAAATGKTLKDALSIISNYLYLHASGIHLIEEAVGDEVRLKLDFLFSNALGSDQLMQLSVVQLATFTASLIGIAPSEFVLHLRQPPHSFPETYKPRFPSIRFLQEFDGIAVTTKQLRQTCQHNERLLNIHLQNYLRQLQNDYPGSLEEQIGEIISQLLPAGECSLERVAATLNMHPRTLQKRLQAIDSSYRAILQGTRMQLAQQQLKLGHSSITELALQLGYSNIAVFGRHFKRWTGLSPRDWKKQHTQSVIGNRTE